MNKCIFIGNLGSDPTYRQTGSGTPVSNVAIAVDNSYVDSTGTKRSETIWVNLVFWGTQATSVKDWLQKGSKIAVETAMKNREFQNAEGTTVRRTEFHVSSVQFLGKVRSREEVNARRTSTNTTSTSSTTNETEVEITI